MLQNNNVEIQNIISKLAKHFLRGSIKFSLDLEEIGFLNLDVQEAFLQSTIHLDLLKKYPLNNSFCKVFFKKLISYLEGDQEIHDEIYLFLCSEMGKSPDDDGFCYRHYMIEDNSNSLVTVKETKNMVVHGTTGMKTWEAAFMLSDWALCNKHTFKNKKVLELGSGVGFTGVTIAGHCDIQSIILTDHHEEVLSTIRDNIKINFPNFSEEETDNITMFTDGHKSLGITLLDWNCIEDHIPDKIIPDILIGADIVYDPSIVPALCNVIQTFCRKNINLDVYISSVIRNVETFGEFLKALDNSGLKYEKIFQPQPVYLDWDYKTEKMLLKIKYKQKL